MAALNCSKLSNWVRKLGREDPVVQKKRKEAEYKKELWTINFLCSGIVRELVDKVQAESRRVMLKIIDRAWDRVEVRSAWGWLKSDKSLQRSIMSMIRKEDVR